MKQKEESGSLSYLFIAQLTYHMNESVMRVEILTIIRVIYKWELFNKAPLYLFVFVLKENFIVIFTFTLARLKWTQK